MRICSVDQQWARLVFGNDIARRAWYLVTCHCQEVPKLKNAWDKVYFPDATHSHIRLSKTIGKDSWDIRAVCSNAAHVACSWTHGAYRTRPCGAAWAYLQCFYDKDCLTRADHRRKMEYIISAAGKPKRETAREEFLTQEHAMDIVKHELDFDTLGAHVELDVLPP